MKQNYTMYIYKQDRRFKTGERLFTTAVYCDRDDNGMRREVAELFGKTFARQRPKPGARSTAEQQRRDFSHQVLSRFKLCLGGNNRILWHI